MFGSTAGTLFMEQAALGIREKRSNAAFLIWQCKQAFESTILAACDAK